MQVEFAVCCNTLQCVVVCYSVLQCVAVCCNLLQCVVVCCSALLCVAVCCCALQWIAVCCSVWPCVLQCVAVSCEVLHKCCSMLQCIIFYTYVYIYISYISTYRLQLLCQNTVCNTLPHCNLWNALQVTSPKKNITLMEEMCITLWRDSICIHYVYTYIYFHSLSLSRAHLYWIVLTFFSVFFGVFRSQLLSFSRTLSLSQTCNASFQVRIWQAVFVYIYIYTCIYV